MLKFLSKFLILMSIIFFITGCFSVMRIPMKQSATIIEDPVTHETYETNVVYGTVPNYPMTIFPTLHLRWHLLSFAWEPAAYDYRWRKFLGPCAFVGSLIGLPGDALVDLIYLPWDINTSKTNTCQLCAEIKSLKTPKTVSKPKAKKKHPCIVFKQQGTNLVVEVHDMKTKNVSVK